MEKRVFLAILLSFVVLAVYQTIFPPTPSKPAAAAVGTTTAAAADANAPATPAGGAVSGSATQAARASAPAAAPMPAALVADTAARDVTVDTDAVHAVFSTEGATLKHWELKHFLEAGKPLDLVPSELPATFPRPFTLTTDDPAISRTLATALFKPSTDGLSLGSAPGQISFEYRDASGVTARKTFYFQPEGRSYVLKVEAAVDVNGTSKPVTIMSGPMLGLGYQPDGSRTVAPRAVQYPTGDKVRRLSASSLAKQSQYQGEFKFAGVEDQYFLNAALPGSEHIAIDYEPITLPVPGGTAKQTRTFVSYRLTVPGSLAMPFYVGPKEFDTLRSVDPRLELVRAIDFGIFAWLVVPLLQTLKWLNGYIGNYGWSIVALTAIINLIIFPLRHRSMVSMRKMQAVQPEVKAIQDRYAKYKLTDPERQKMNQEMMALYKQKGVNPASGCLPMLLTLPILYAIYAMLYAAIELRGAPFVGWITDLSRHDPLYITPLLMGVSMLWQQRMMPATADPIQRKMFMLMPVIFTVSFLWAPSGLVIYWFVSNLLAIGQQYITNRIIGTPVPATAAVPRRRRIAGNGGARPS